MSALLSLDRIYTRYDGKTVLAGASLEVPARRSVALIGPSGCGKSTLLRVAIGLVRPDEGTVRLTGEALTPETRRGFRLRTGYVIQDGGLFPHLTALANVSLVARHVGWAPRRVAARVAELCELTGMDLTQLARYPSQLSGGQRQRVGIMRALMLDPDLLLLDEPLAALDPVMRGRLQRDLHAMFARLDKTVLLVTHDLGEAAYLGHEVAIMDAGRVLQQGPFREIVERPATPFVAEFIRAQRPPWSEATVTATEAPS